jgi:hypothetical protein
MANRATPARIDKYEIALQGHKTFKMIIPENEW